MTQLAFSKEHLIINSRWRRSRTLYYEEIQEVQADGQRLDIGLFDGTRVIRSLSPETAASAALQLHAIVAGTSDALAKTHNLGDLRSQVSQWLSQRGFTATPFVKYLIHAATRLGASDVHLLPERDGFTLSLRKNGSLVEVGSVSRAVAHRMTGRLKVLCGLRVHRRDIVQEGRARLESLAGDLRVSFVPTLGSESVAIRLFDKLKAAATLDDLGFDRETTHHLTQLLAVPRGVVVFAGPSGSGKTTTLYTALRKRLREGGGTVRAVTVEDPVEYSIDGAVQLEVDESTGQTGPDLVRAALRQDANILAVGEVRDPQTAELCIRAGLTGHQVLSTVHAGSAPEALMRLLELGVPAHLLGSAVAGVVAQRLIRCQCTTCAPTGPESLGHVSTECRECGGLGFSSRRAIAEVLVLDPKTRRLLGETPNLDVLVAGTRGSMGATLREAADALLAQGVTDGAEVARVMG